MSFQALLDDLELLKKSMDDDDAKIAAAAADGDDEDDKHAEPDGDEDGEDTDGDGDGDGDGNEMMGKSFEFELDNGEKVQAFDATELVKSLQAEVAQLRQGPEALGQAVELIKSLQGQVSALTAKVAELSNAGRGRKTVLSVAEKPGAPMAKSEGHDRETVMAKCLNAQRSGALSAVDVSRAETAFNAGIPLPPDIAARIQ